jgi:hypothetical protein
VLELSDGQIKTASEIFRDIGQVSLASVVLPAFVPAIDTSLLGLGIVGMFGAWFISIALVRNL